MIRYLKRNQINIEKYDTCIENAVQSRIYAFSWYLDIVAENWDVLVLDDYEAVMPLPWKQKYFIKYISQPFFCQQLGIFSLKKNSQEIAQKFIRKIPKKFLKITLQLNSENCFEEINLEKKVNYILSLNTSYTFLFKSFNKGRKHAVKVGDSHSLTIKNITIDQLIKLTKENYTYANSLGNDFKKLKKLTSYILANNKGSVVGVFKEDIVLGGAIILKDNYRITYLFSSFTNEAKKKQAPSFLINTLIKEYAETSFVFDFEGSTIFNIASFYRSFGAIKESYNFFKKINL